MKPEDPVNDDARPEQPLRKPYDKPRLEVYGGLAEISKSLNMGSVNDGAGHPNKHFTN